MSYRSSGLTIYAEALANGLLEHRYEVRVIAALRPQLLAYQQIDQLDWITYSWRATKLLHELQQQQPFDLVYFLDLHFAYHSRGFYVASLWQFFRQRLTAWQGRPYSTVRSYEKALLA